MKNWNHDILNSEDQNPTSEWDEFINSSETDEETKDKLLNINDWLAHGRIDEERANALRNEVLSKTPTTAPELAPASTHTPISSPYLGRRATMEFLRTVARNQKQAEQVPELSGPSTSPSQTEETPPRSKGEDQAKVEEVNRLEDENRTDQANLIEIESRLEELKRLRDANRADREKLRETRGRLKELSQLKGENQTDQENLAEIEGRIDELYQLRGENQTDQENLAEIEGYLDELKRLRDAGKSPEEIKRELERLKELERQKAASQLKNSTLTNDFPINDLDISGVVLEPPSADHIEDPLAYEPEATETPKKTKEKSQRHSSGLLSWLLGPSKSRKIQSTQPAPEPEVIPAPTPEPPTQEPQPKSA